MAHHRVWIRILFIFVLAGCLAIASPALAQEPSPTPVTGAQGRDPVFEQKILDELQAVNPQAVAVFAQANADLDAENYQAAKAGFEQVLALAPGFSHALRRLAATEMYLDDYTSAEAHARQALAIEPADYNQIQLAMLLVSKGGAAEATEALELARKAVQANPNDVINEYVLMWAGVQRTDYDAMRQATAYLVTAAAEAPDVHYIAGMVAAHDNQWEKAESELLLARKLGFDQAEVDKALNGGVTSQAAISRWTRYGLYTLGVWLAGMAVLFVVGLGLSGMTLAIVQRTPAQEDARPGLVELVVRSLYRLVIWLASVYFYISLPILLLLTVALVGGVIFFFFYIGRIPLQIAGLVVIGGLVSIYAILRSLLVFNKDREPGRPLKPEESPQLWQLTREVAERLNTRPIQAIYITPGAEIAVLERGGMLRRMTGKGQRSLILGLGDLEGLDQGQLRAILAHEYGHFNNRDTAGGRLAGQVMQSMQRMGSDLASSGQGVFWNPAWLFVNAYIRLFVVITHGASRLQEVLADRFATLAYGSANFIEGLRQVVRQSVVFNYNLNQRVKVWLEKPLYAKEEIPAEVFNQSPSGLVFRAPELSGLYSLGAQSTDTELETAVQKAYDAKTSVYDSHPSLRERIALAQALPGRLGEVDHRPAWELVDEPEALQQEMLEVVAKGLVANVTRQILAQRKPR